MALVTAQGLEVRSLHNDAADEAWAKACGKKAHHGFELGGMWSLVRKKVSSSVCTDDVDGHLLSSVSGCG